MSNDENPARGVCDAPDAPTAKPYDRCPASGCAGLIRVIERTERIYRPEQGWTDDLDEYLLWCDTCDEWSEDRTPDEACTPGGMDRVGATIARAEAANPQPPDNPGSWSGPRLTTPANPGILRADSLQALADHLDERRDFETPGGASALRRATGRNPRDLACPTCGQPDRLTPQDARRGYQCDTCADRDEGCGPDGIFG